MWYLFGILATSLILAMIHSIPEVLIGLSVLSDKEMTPASLTAGIIVGALIWPITLTLILFALLEDNNKNGHV